MVQFPLRIAISRLHPILNLCTKINNLKFKFCSLKFYSSSMKSLGDTLFQRFPNPTGYIDVGEGCFMWMTTLRCGWQIIQIWKDTNIVIPLPTSYNYHYHKVTNITVTWPNTLSIFRADGAEFFVRILEQSEFVFTWFLRNLRV